MLALLGALVAGLLTTLAPCVLPLLPVIVGGSIQSGTGDRRSGLRRALLVTGGLAVSVVVFTLLLKASTLLIDIPPSTWRWAAGGLLIVLGMISVFPTLWEALSRRFSLQQHSSARLASARQRGGPLGAVITGAALGPVFSSCSPMYGYVVVTVLPSSPLRGMLLLGAYVLGLSGALLAVSLFGQAVIRRVGWLADADGWFRKGLGVVFVLVGVAVIMGWDQQLQTWLIEYSPIRPWELDGGFIPE